MVAPVIDGFCVVELNEFGPVHEYVAPVTVGVVKLIVAPVHIGVLLPAVGVAGVVFTTTAVVPTALVQPPTVTVKLYVPAIAAVAPVRVGFCRAEVNALGPVHAYVAPVTAVVVKLIVFPVHTGLLLDGAGVAGVLFTTTVVVPTKLVHPLTVTVTLYVPAIAAVAPVRVGFCKAEVNVLGPVQAYVAPVTVGVVKFIVLPVHTGVLLPAVGVAGTGFTVIVILFDVAGFPVTPGKLEVMIHVTI